MDIMWLHDVSESDARIAAKLVADETWSFDEGETIPSILERLSVSCIHKTHNEVGRTSFKASEGLKAWFDELDDKTRARLRS